MASTTVENYVKRIYLEQQRNGGDVAAMGRIARAMGVTPGTATSMVKTLLREGLVDYEPRSGAGLTARGRRLALRVLRRHRMIELFLVETLGLDWSEVHEEAERLEHAVSDQLLERIDRHLGRPRVDPHGDPIPSPDGRIAAQHLDTLASREGGAVVRIERIRDQSPAFLRFIERCGLAPGTAVTVTGKEPAADTVELRLADGRPVTIGLAAADKILTSNSR